jgi:hypothetical protein
MLLSILPAATVADSDSGAPAIAAAEWDVLAQINRVRENNGLPALRMDARVREVAGARSRSMRDQDYFSHVQPNGQNVGDILDNRHINNWHWGEIIGWTSNINLADGVEGIVDAWRDSPGHRAIMLSSRYNYVGVGISRGGFEILWTVVFTSRADHTPPVAGLTSPGPTAATKVSSDATTISWWGRDRPLATRMAGLRGFTLQHRLPGGRWVTLFERTTLRQKTWDLRPGDHWFRVRATDRRGNTTRWQGPLHIYVP